MIISKEFEKSIERDDDKKDINYEYGEIIVSSDYKGPTLEFEEEITSEWVEKLMHFQKD